MYKYFIFFFLLLVLSFESYAQDDIEIQKSPFNIGESLTFSSQILEESRELNIYLPNSYSRDSARQYPIIYLLDGSREEDFIHIAGLVQFGSFSWINMLPESIVVGIANVDRRRDFSYPSSNERDKADFPTAGGSAKFMDFLAKEVQPLVGKNYRTQNNKTLIGQSFGGLLATEVLFKRPDLFDNYIIVSPSLWWDEESLLAFDPFTYSKPKSIYVAVGKEGAVMERLAKSLYEKLEALQISHSQLYYHYLEAQDHGDALHLAVYDAFEKMFRKKE